MKEIKYQTYMNNTSPSNVRLAFLNLATIILLHCSSVSISVDYQFKLGELVMNQNVILNFEQDGSKS
ncbi:hypothetical protein FORC23_0020 [Vibrio parahaemolyticus]|nr:hypothetical protein FORC23_0020 [Vibrio parahaemolyticus]